MAAWSQKGFVDNSSLELELVNLQIRNTFLPLRIWDKMEINKIYVFNLQLYLYIF